MTVPTFRVGSVNRRYVRFKENWSEYCLRFAAMDIRLNGTSRTDAGVHALGQRASFKGDFGIPADRIKIAANNLLCGGNERWVQMRRRADLRGKGSTVELSCPF